MHILLLPSWYKTPKESIVGTFFEEQARMLQRHGHIVGVLYPKHYYGFFTLWRFQDREQEPASYIDRGIPTFYSFTQSCIPKNKAITPVDKAIICRRADRIYRDYVHAHGIPDVLHAHTSLNGGIVAEYLGNKYNIPYLLTEHFSYLIPSEKTSISIYQKKLVSRIFSNARQAFAVSTFFKEQLCKHYDIDQKHLRVIPNLVNPIFFDDLKSTGISQPVQCIIIANLKEEKNHKLAINALERCRKDYDINYELKIVGEGYYEWAIRDYVAEHRLESRVLLLGEQNRKTIKELLNQSHLLLSPSLFETFGITIAEALACGRPVVALDSGGVRDTIGPKDGIIVDQNDAEEFAKAIKYVVDNYHNYDQISISQRCKTLFSEEQIYKILDQSYQQAISIKSQFS